jgi:hypothetical protein
LRFKVQLWELYRIGGNIWNTFNGPRYGQFWGLGKQVINGSTVVPQQYYDYWPGGFTAQPVSTQVRCAMVTYRLAN